MSKQRAIVYDCDDVFVNFIGHLCTIGRNLGCTEHKGTDIKEWELPEDLIKVFKEYENWIYVSAPILPKVKKHLEEVRKMGIKIIIMTARDGEFGKQTKFNLALNGIEYDLLLFNKNKTLKINRLAEEYDIVAFADDRAMTINKAAQETDVKNIYLINMPSNRHEEMDSRVKRINNICDINLGDLR